MSHTVEPKEARQAAIAWIKGDYETGRLLYARCIEIANKPGDHLPASFYLCEWARMEGTIKNRDAFEKLYQEAISLEPNAPMIRLWYARDLWLEFEDGSACNREIEKLESLLSSDRWDPNSDISPLAYTQKIETIKSWVRGEPGGKLEP